MPIIREKYNEGAEDNLEIKIERGRDFQHGNFLNSLDELVCIYRHDGDMSDDDIVKSMTFYIETGIQY